VNILNYSQNQYNWSRGNSSNKLFEYMASAKPIISTVKMGYSIIDKYQCGIEIENCSGSQLAEAIIKIKTMSSQEYRCLGENAKKGALDYDYDLLTEKLINVIEYVNYLRR
jgi:glycosyltransferase involved in cell wall biosynthesis